MMLSRPYRAFQSLILVLLGLFLLNKIWNGTVFWYINERFLPLTLIGALGLIWLARALLIHLQTERSEDHEHIHGAEFVGGHNEAPTQTREMSEGRAVLRKTQNRRARA